MCMQMPCSRVARCFQERRRGRAKLWNRIEAIGLCPIPQSSWLLFVICFSASADQIRRLPIFHRLAVP